MAAGVVSSQEEMWFDDCEGGLAIKPGIRNSDGRDRSSCRGLYLSPIADAIRKIEMENVKWK